MLNRKEVTVLKKVIKEITAKKVDRNFWIEDKGHTCFGMDYFFLRLRTENIPQDLNIPISLQKEEMMRPIEDITNAVYIEAEDTDLRVKSGKDLLKIVSRLSDQKLVYVNDKFDFGLEDCNISVESINLKDYPITLYEKGNLQIYVLPVRVEEKNKFLK